MTDETWATCPCSVRRPSGPDRWLYVAELSPQLGKGTTLLLLIQVPGINIMISCNSIGLYLSSIQHVQCCKTILLLAVTLCSIYLSTHGIHVKFNRSDEAWNVLRATTAHCGWSVGDCRKMETTKMLSLSSVLDSHMDITTHSAVV